MNDAADKPDSGGPAPADARPHPRWPLWKRALAYLVLALIALLCIGYIDLKAHQSVEARVQSRACSDPPQQPGSIV